MFWRILKPCGGLADEPSVRNTKTLTAALVLVATVLLSPSGFSASPGASPSEADPNSPSTLSIDYLAKTLPPHELRDPAWAATNTTVPSYTIRHTASEVRLQFSAVDERGRLVTDLSADDIRILDDNDAVAGVRHFTRADDLPLQVGLLLDVSDSVQKSIAREKQATTAFVERVMRPQADRAFVMAFGRDVRLWQASTSDQDTLSRAVHHIQQVGYTTSLYDSIFYACRNEFPSSNSESGTQRILLLFSDGEDTGSFHAMADAIAQAQRREIQIYALSVHPGRRYAPGDSILRRLADETGGQLYVATNEKDFSAIFAAMERQMRTQYYVSFPPGRPTLGFHDLRIETTHNRNLRIHARQGYYFDAQ
jgi:VWFA-related protein